MHEINKMSKIRFKCYSDLFTHSAYTIVLFRVYIIETLYLFLGIR